MTSGVSDSPSPLVISAGSSGKLTLAAAADAAVGTGRVSLAAVSGSLNASGSFSLVVGSPPQFAYVGGEPFMGFWDESRQLLFAGNTSINEVDVVGGADMSVKARISVPLPFGIDQMADGKTLVVGTRTQAIYTIDEDTLAVTQHLAPNFSYMNTTTYFDVAAMANGKVLIIGQDPLIEDSNFHLIKWDSNTGTFTNLFPATITPGGPPYNFTWVKRSADHQWAITTADQVYLYNSSSDSFTSVALPDTGDVEDVAANPTGTQFAVVSAQTITFLDQGLNVVGTVSPPLAQVNVFNYDFTAYSPDGTRFYLQLPYNLDVIDAVNFVELGAVPTQYDIFQPWLLAVDSKQRAFMGAAGGVAVADTSTLFQGRTPFYAFTPSPGVIPLGSSTPVSFGNIPAGTTITFNGIPGTMEGGSVVPPQAGAAGPVDLGSMSPQGEVTLTPIGFEYGVDVVTATATLLPPLGSPTIGVFGFGVIDSSGGAPAVTVGGQSAQVTAPSQSGLEQEILVQVPSGGSGAPAITVSNAYGGGALQNAMTYIPSATIVPDSGVGQLLYDSHRNLLYALKAKQIDVLNPSTLKFQTPLLPGGTGGFSYTAMALTPDGSKMLVVDPGANPTTLTIFNPDNPAQSTTVPLMNYDFHGIVTTSTGKAFLFNATAPASGSPLEFDLATMTYSMNLVNSNGFGSLTHFAATPDGNHVATASDDEIATISIWNSANDTFTNAYYGAFWNDVALSPDGSTIAVLTGGPGYAGAAAAFFDELPHFFGATFYPDLSSPLQGEVLGAVFSPSGQTLVSPLADSIEFFNVATGRLMGRLMTPEALPVWDEGYWPSQALALDPTGQTIFANSASGVTVLKLPVPIDQLSPPASIYSYRTAGPKISRVRGAHGKSPALRDLLPRVRDFGKGR
jgi:WD40 repeat protein